jgi:prepilin-type N-terminal cleavage/methylation domain-containing protein
MKKKTVSPAFTLIELLVVIAIIAVPALTSAMARGQMTGTVNNARQFYLASYQMALDGSTNSDSNLAWPGDYASGVASLQDYCTKLVQNDYLKVGDLSKLLSAPGATCTATGAGDPITVTLTDIPGVKVYKVKDTDSTNTIFAVSKNYTYNTGLTAATSPFGDKGFVVMHKGGDGNILRKNNATVANYSSDSTKFQAAIGKLAGDADGTASSSDTGADGRAPLTPP